MTDFYRDHLSDESLTGVVADFNSRFLLLSLLSEDGEDDGISIVFRENITRIRTGGNERGAVGELSVFQSTELKFPNIDLTSIGKVLSYIQAAYGYVNIHAEDMANDMCFIGEIKDQDNDWVSLRGYGTKTARDINNLLLEKEEISRVDSGAKYEESIKFLAKAKK